VLAALFRALDQPLIGPVVERVSARRIEFLSEAFRTAGFDPTHAANRARLAYSAYVGFVQLSRIGQPRMSHEEFEAYIRDFIETLVPRKCNARVIASPAVPLSSCPVAKHLQVARRRRHSLGIRKHP